eukprot:1838833-Rhodomonas_salina.1
MSTVACSWCTRSDAQDANTIAPSPFNPYAPRSPALPRNALWPHQSRPPTVPENSSRPLTSPPRSTRPASLPERSVSLRSLTRTRSESQPAYVYAPDLQERTNVRSALEKIASTLKAHLWCAHELSWIQRVWLCVTPTAPSILACRSRREERREKEREREREREREKGAHVSLLALQSR